MSETNRNPQNEKPLFQSSEEETLNDLFTIKKSKKFPQKNRRKIQKEFLSTINKEYEQQASDVHNLTEDIKEIKLKLQKKDIDHRSENCKLKAENMELINKIKCLEDNMLKFEELITWLQNQLEEKDNFILALTEKIEEAEQDISVIDRLFNETTLNSNLNKTREKLFFSISKNVFDKILKFENGNLRNIEFETESKERIQELETRIEIEKRRNFNLEKSHGITKNKYDKFKIKLRSLEERYIELENEKIRLEIELSEAKKSLKLLNTYGRYFENKDSVINLRDCERWENEIHDFCRLKRNYEKIKICLKDAENEMKILQKENLILRNQICGGI